MNELEDPALERTTYEGQGGLTSNLLTSTVLSCSYLTLRPHGLWPASLLRPEDSPGKNTGEGSHSLLQGIFINPGIEPRSPALRADSLPSEPLGSPGPPGKAPLILKILFL